jgi:proline dehydrogenase
MKIFLLNKSFQSNLRFISTASVLKTPARKTDTVNASNQPQLKKIGHRDQLDTSFNNPIDAFKSKTTFELLRAYFVYLLCSSEYLVENNMKVIN